MSSSYQDQTELPDTAVVEATKYQMLGEDGFEDRIIDAFSPTYALRILSNSKPLPPGFRECALAALCTWVFSPKDDDLREAAVATAAAAHLAKIEQHVIRTGSKKDLIRPLAHMLQAQDFYEQIYYPLGGIKAISKAKPSGAIRSALEKKRIKLDRALLMMKISHWVVDQRSPRLLQASIEKSSEAASALDKTSGSPRTFKNDWSAHQSNISIAYAASLIKTEDKSTLLDCFQTGRVGRITAGKLRELAAVSSYVTSDILSQFWSDEARLVNALAVPAEKLAPPPSRFTSEQKALIVRIYTPKKYTPRTIR